jgi:hypothetical protein
VNYPGIMPRNRPLHKVGIRPQLLRLQHIDGGK